MPPGGAPKAPLAIDVWRRNAAAVEAHLAFRGLNIADWHQDAKDERGRLILSSRKLLVLCEHIPELGGKWPVALKVANEIHREAALHRNALYAGGENSYLVPGYMCPPDEVRSIVDPEVLMAMIEEQIEAPKRVAEAMDSFYSDQGLMAPDDDEAVNDAD